MKCIRCESEMALLENETDAVKTYTCTECGLIENYFNPEALKMLLDKARRVEDD